MDTYVHSWQYLAEFRMRNVSDKIVEKIKTHILRSVTVFPKIVQFMR
jgi:hypothetical protein